MTIGLRKRMKNQRRRVNDEQQGEENPSRICDWNDFQLLEIVFDIWVMDAISFSFIY